MKKHCKMHFKNNATPMSIFLSSLFKWMNFKQKYPPTQKKNKKNKTNLDRNIKCPSVSARAHHPSCCVLLSSDERQPPNMWQGRRPCGKWCGNAQYIQFSTAKLFKTCNLQTISPPLHCWYSALKIKCSFLWVFFSFCVYCLSILAIIWRREGAHPERLLY